jgi:hypothetical protein
LALSLICCWMLILPWQSWHACGNFFSYILLLALKKCRQWPCSTSWEHIRGISLFWSFRPWAYLLCSDFYVHLCITKFLLPMHPSCLQIYPLCHTSSWCDT